MGGGLRDIYGWGVFDHCLDNDIHFDVCVGVSAGSANTSTYLAGQKKRNIPFYLDYPMRKEYMSIGNFFKKGSFLDLDYVYKVLSNSDGENPIDYPALMANPGKLIVVATCAETAEPVYFTKEDLAQDKYDAFKSSSAIPFVCKPYATNGIPCYDGALSDTIPVDKAFEEGCDKVVLILSKPRDTERTPGKDPLFASLIKRRYPKAAEAMKNRYLSYNKGVAKAKEYEKEGKLLILSPDSIEGMSTLKRDVDAMKKLYEKGYNDAQAIHKFIEE